MKFLRVAQLGTFDLDNLGDLLFPLVFDKLLRKLEADLQIKIECDLFGLKGAGAATIYSDQIECHPIAAFTSMDEKFAYDLIFIGGGDIVREDDDALQDIYGPSSDRFSYPQLLSPIGSAKNRLVLLSPGAPFPLSGAFEMYLRNSFQRLLKASLRDRESADMVADLVSGSIEIEVIPDIVNAISAVFSSAELQSNRKAIIPEEYLQRGYICFQVRATFFADYSSIGEYLLDLQRKTGLQIVLLEIGRCLGDDKVLSKIAEDFGFLYINNSESGRGGAISMLDKVSVVAGSSAFIGTSLHGNIIARAYQVPYFTFGNSKLIKMAGFFKSVGRVCFFETLQDLFLNVDEVNRQINPAGQFADVAESTAFMEVYNFVRASFRMALEAASIEPSAYSASVNDVFLLANEDRLTRIERLRQLENMLRERSEHNAALQHEIERCEHQLAVVGREIGEKNRLVAARDQEISRLNQEASRLNQEVSSRQNEMNKVFVSKSWLFTKPLRDLRRKLNGGS
ncbi:MAG TPA: polysaccharide pyruvyl transferase family protein [Spongiibacteraceae bacterium]|nr:polysaccharide pyruvyl transferase family protein [Spongiibacteraceae bacterium]